MGDQNGRKNRPRRLRVLFAVTTVQNKFLIVFGLLDLPALDPMWTRNKWARNISRCTLAPDRM